MKITVNRQTAVLSGTVAARALVIMGDILARQIEGISATTDETHTLPEDATLSAGQREKESVREAVQFLYATDQTLRSGVQVSLSDGYLTLQGEVSSIAQKNWAEQLAEAAGGEVQSRLKVTEATTFAPAASTEPPQIDDESQEALVLFRLRLVRETEHLPVRVKANRGIVDDPGQSSHGSSPPARGKYRALDAGPARIAQLDFDRGLMGG